jgi:hypothetical protein
VICFEARFWIGRELEKRDVRLEKDMEGSGAILAFPGVTEENHEKYRVGYQVDRRRLQSNNS